MEWLPQRQRTALHFQSYHDLEFLGMGGPKEKVGGWDDVQCSACVAGRCVCFGVWVRVRVL